MPFTAFCLILQAPWGLESQAQEPWSFVCDPFPIQCCGVSVPHGCGLPCRGLQAREWQRSSRSTGRSPSCCAIPVGQCSWAHLIARKPQWWSDAWVVTLRVRTRERIVICLFFLLFFLIAGETSFFLVHWVQSQLSSCDLWRVIRTLSYILSPPHPRLKKHHPTYHPQFCCIPSFKKNQLRLTLW